MIVPTRGNDHVAAQFNLLAMTSAHSIWMQTDPPWIHSPPGGFRKLGNHLDLKLKTIQPRHAYSRECRVRRVTPESGTTFQRAHVRLRVTSGGFSYAPPLNRNLIVWLSHVTPVLNEMRRGVQSERMAEQFWFERIRLA